MSEFLVELHVEFFQNFWKNISPIPQSIVCGKQLSFNNLLKSSKCYLEVFLRFRVAAQNLPLLPLARDPGKVK